MAQNKYEEIKTIYHQQDKKNKHSLESINDDYIGWLSVKNTNIDYPVVRGTNNQYYLNHNFYQEEDFVGSIFMDYRNKIDPIDQHSIIYGHNMKDKSMFGSLSDILENPSFEDYEISFEVDDKTYVWEVFSAYVSTKTEWMQKDFDTTEEYNRFLEHIMDSSIQLSDHHEVEQIDRIITLATCITNNSDKRFIVHGKLVEEIK